MSSINIAVGRRSNVFGDARCLMSPISIAVDRRFNVFGDARF